MTEHESVVWDMLIQAGYTERQVARALVALNLKDVIFTSQVEHEPQESYINYDNRQWENAQWERLAVQLAHEMLRLGWFQKEHTIVGRKLSFSPLITEANKHGYFKRSYNLHVNNS